MRLDEAALDTYTDDFAESAWRHETRDGYDVASDEGAFTRYTAGEDPAPGFGEGWHRWLAARRAENRQVRRLRVLHDRPTPYLLYEIEWCYLRNSEFGEQIRILDLTETRRPAELVDEEFWMLDSARVAVMTYDDDGAFLRADTADGADAALYVASAHTGWDAATPLHDWWHAHPEYHRQNWLATRA